MDDLVLLLTLGSRLEVCPGGMEGNVRQFLARGLLKVRNKRRELVPLVANRVQREFERRAGRHNIVLKARQVGITTWIAARLLLAAITRPGVLSVQVAHDQDSAEEIFRIVHRFLENLPEGLRKGALATSRANVRQIVFPRLDSEYRVETAADPNAGRGLTIHYLHCSEVARWPRDAAATLASLRAAVAPGGEVTLESTPNGAGGCFYDEWQRAAETGCVRHFFPWWYEESYRAPGPGDEQRTTDDASALAPLSAEEEKLVAEHGLDVKQIAFRREMRVRFGPMAPQEFAEDAESCFLASGDCVFDIAGIEAQLARCTPPAESLDNGHLRLWWPPQAGHTYIAGVDPAGGGSEGDFACAAVIDAVSGLQCAELHGHFPPQELAQRVIELGRRYGDALLAVERNNHGHGVLAHLAAMGYENVYEQRGQAGWLTSAATRPQLIANFAAVLAHAPELISSDRLLRECRSFVRHADGSAAAAAGAHDDCVFAMAIALAVRAETASRNGTLQLGILPVREREMAV
jgi:hypothetical protein